MGVCCSSSVLFPEVEKWRVGNDVQYMMGKLGLSKHDLHVMYGCFSQIDMDKKTGLVELKKFSPKSEFENIVDIVFGIVDRDYDRRLSFFEYTLACWNFVTLEKDKILDFFFDIYDIERSGTISPKEFKHMVGMMWKFSDDSHIRSLYDAVDEISLQFIPISRLLEISNKSALMLVPVYAFQSSLRDTTLGKFQWDHITKYRISQYPEKSIFDIVDGLDRRKAIQHVFAIQTSVSQCKLDKREKKESARFSRQNSESVLSSQASDHFDIVKATSPMRRGGSLLSQPSQSRIAVYH